MRNKWFLLILLIFSTISMKVFASDIKPSSSFYVYDDTGILSDQTKQDIMLTNFSYEETKEKPQIVVVMTKEDIDVDTEAPKIFESFGIGNKKDDNGVLILYSEPNKKMRLEIGYGLEGAITDAQSGDILDKVVDNFKTDDKYKIDNSVQSIFSDVATLVDKEYNFDIYKNKTDIQKGDKKETSPTEKLLITIGIIALIVVWIGIFIYDPELALNILLIFVQVLANSSSSSSSKGGRGGGGRSGGAGASR